MPVATHRSHRFHRPPRLPIPRASRSTTTAPVITEGDELNYQEIYETLYEAAHLVTCASRQPRYAKQNRSGLVLQDVADEIHDQIRRLPSSVTDRPARPLSSRTL